MSELFQQAAQAISKADSLVITAGAGMGVDSGLPDFRGDDGFWNAYPPFAQRGLSFMEVADPFWFDTEPQTAWGFYGHRMNLYRATQPHAGFGMLLEWAKQKDTFVFTSNVDGHFQKAGFDAAKIVECHGSILHAQCAKPCDENIWPADDIEVDIEEETFQAQEPLPTCPHCQGLARPNVLMFSDRRWIWNRTREQEARFETWQAKQAAKEVTVIEFGAGGAVPTVRYASESLKRLGATLIRVNPREAEGPAGTISLECGALEAIRGLQAALDSLPRS